MSAQKRIEKKRIEKKENRKEENFLSSSQIHGLPEENIICDYLKYYYQCYNQYNGVTARPQEKDYQTIKELKISVNNDLEKFKKIVNAFFENKYFFNRDDNKRPVHYLKSLLTNIGVVAKDINLDKPKELTDSERFEKWKKENNR